MRTSMKTETDTEYSEVQPTATSFNGEEHQIMHPVTTDTSMEQQTVLQVTDENTQPITHDYGTEEAQATPDIQEVHPAATHYESEEHGTSVTDIQDLHDVTEAYAPPVTDVQDMHTTTTEDTTEHPVLHSQDAQPVTTDVEAQEAGDSTPVEPHDEIHVPDIQTEQPVATDSMLEQQTPVASSDVQPTWTTATTEPLTSATAQAENRATTGQAVVGDTGHTDELQQLQAQIESLQQQLQDAKAQLQAAKERETQLKTAKEREQQLQSIRQKMQELQAELEATHAELQETHTRIGQFQ